MAQELLELLLLGRAYAEFSAMLGDVLIFRAGNSNLSIVHLLH